MEDEEAERKLLRKIGSLLIVGFQGTKSEEEGPQKVWSLLKNGKLGGVILFRHNIVGPKQLSDLTEYIHSAKEDVLIAIDQEGGRVQRLVESKGFKETPSAQVIGETCADPEGARDHYRLMAEELAKYHINVNFGPVVDLNNPNRPSPAIGKYERSYGNDPDRVSQFAEVFIKAHHEKKIATALKHFPGHGYSTADTHHGISDTTQTADPETELTPYKNLIPSRADMIMTAHIVNKNYDPAGYPATLSSVIIPEKLRGELKYNGVVVSDDLLMGAIQNYYELPVAVTLALNATCDLLLFSNNTLGTNTATTSDLPLWKIEGDVTETVIGIIRQKITDGEIKAERIKESYKRVKKLKAKFH